MNLKPCWSCGAKNRPCFDTCDCAKCVDPTGYSDWKNDNPDEYREWLERERDDD